MIKDWRILWRTLEEKRIRVGGARIEAPGIVTFGDGGIKPAGDDRQSVHHAKCVGCTVAEEMMSE